MEMKYSTGRYVQVAETVSGNFLGLGTRQVKIDSPSAWLSILELLKKAKEPVTLSELEKSDNLSSEPGWLRYLIDNHFITQQLNGIEDNRYKRTFLYYQSIGLNPYLVEENLKKSSVIILGCGGIGNHISAALASNGVGTIYLVDGDHIELSNLTRQFLFTEKDVGKKKIDVLAERLKERNSECDIRKLNFFIKNEDNLNILPSSDLIILSADSDGLVNIVNTFCMKNKMPYINICYMNDIAVWGPFVVPGKTGCHRCGCLNIKVDGISTGFNNDTISQINNGFKSATFPPVNATASALATSDIIRYLAGSEMVTSFNKRIGFHDYSLKIETQDFSKNKNCNLCKIYD